MQPSSPRSTFGSLIHDVSRMRRTFFDQALKPMGLTRAQWGMMDSLARHPEDGMAQTDLARLLETGKVSVGGLIDRLEESGLVDRRPDRTDRRVKRVFITSKGHHVLERVRNVAQRLDATLFDNVPDSDLDTAATVLTQVKSALRASLRQSQDAGQLPVRRRKTDAMRDA